MVALFHAKDLAFADPGDQMPLRTLLTFYKHQPIDVEVDKTLDLILNDFKQGKSHMAFVKQVFDEVEEDPYYEIVGIVTLEDVSEKMPRSATDHWRT